MSRYWLAYTLATAFTIAVRADADCCIEPPLDKVLPRLEQRSADLLGPRRLHETYREYDFRANRAYVEALSEEDWDVLSALQIVPETDLCDENCKRAGFDVHRTLVAALTLKTSRQELAARRDTDIWNTRMFWISVFTALTALIGAVAAILALFNPRPNKLEGRSVQLLARNAISEALHKKDIPTTGDAKQAAKLNLQMRLKRHHRPKHG